MCYYSLMGLAEIGHAMLKAIFQNKWLSVEYKNKQGNITRYWIGIKDIDPNTGLFAAEGFHITEHSVADMRGLSVSSILSAQLVDESWYDAPESLKEKISLNPEEFQKLFGSVPDMNILDYLCECARLNETPYRADYSLIGHLDGDALRGGEFALTDEQFGEIVRVFQARTKGKNQRKLTRHLCMNVLSIFSRRGLYLLAYRALLLDAKRRVLVPDTKITVCRKFKIGNREEESVRSFLDNDDEELLNDFEANLERIKDAISKRLRFPSEKVDDLPYIIPISWKIPVNLESEYRFIKDEMASGNAQAPLRAFFGGLTRPPARRKEYPLALLSDKANLDQLLAMHNAIKYPLTYVQGPPGTGKTATIINTIFTAFFNEKTVLLSTFNNHPIDEVCAALEGIRYKSGTVPFPVFRIGRNEVTLASLNAWKERYERLCSVPVYEETLERGKEKEKAKSRQFTELIKRYEERLDLEERKDAIEQLLQINDNMTYQFELAGRQLEEVKKKIGEIGDISGKDALDLIYGRQGELLKYVYFTSVKFVKRLGRSENRDLLDIFMQEDDEEKISLFNAFIKKKENIARFLKVFPVVASTCISCGKIGEPGVYFDMAIIDEAGQCDMAYSLLPVLRGRQLMLVGDPQQLSPVILLDPRTNEALKKAYKVPDEYDYVKNSVYQVFLSADSVSREILLSHHYRCPREIISFNNQKYYNNQLKIETSRAEKFPLAFHEIGSSESCEKNVAPAEAEAAISYAKRNPGKAIGIITPFVKQKELIDSLIKESGLKNVKCGTIHAFQGDETDAVLFSLALTEKTPAGTYEWLKNNRELINVATSRARDSLVVFGSEKEISRLHKATMGSGQGQKEGSRPDAPNGSGLLQDGSIADDVFDLVSYIKTRGKYRVVPHETASRALGVKPFSTETEEEFLRTLSHALDNVMTRAGKCSIKKEVPVSAVFSAGDAEPDLFYKGRFDFVIFERDAVRREIPVLAVELDGKEHYESAVVKRRDRQKDEICRRHRLLLIRVDNTYARRYHYIKEVLERFFARR